MRVLIIVPAFPVNKENIKGGVNSALSNLLTGFTDACIDVRVLSFNREVAKELIVSFTKHITFYFIPESKLPHALNFCIAGSATIKKHVREFNPSIVHYAMSGYILLTKLFGLLGKVQMVTIHGIPFAEARQKINLKEKLVYYTNGLVEKLFCPKNVIHISNYSKTQFGLHKNCKTALIPNAIDPNYFTIPLKPTTSNKLLYAGSIEARKNLLFILKTLNILLNKGLNFSLDVVGGFTDEAYKGEILAFIKNNNLEKSVTLHGWVSQKIFQRILSQSDILFVASKQETLPMVIEEAMSAGKVVLCSKTGGIPEMIVHNKDGFLFNSDNMKEVVTILENLYDNNTAIQQIQKTARTNAIEMYDCTKIAQKTISFYESLLL